MPSKEELVWKNLNQRSKDSQDPKWLGKMYSDELSLELRQAIAENLGMKSKDGWPILKILFDKYGVQPELIYAAGICHQPEAKDLLFKLLNIEKIDLVVIEALACWGASMPKETLIKILKKPEQNIRLAGLELLKFKASELSDDELISMTSELINDYRDPIIIKVIKILQRRDGAEICNVLKNLVINGSESVSHAALMALGSIGTEDSFQVLSELIKTLPNGIRLEFAKKQIKYQYRFS